MENYSDVDHFQTGKIGGGLGRRDRMPPADPLPGPGGSAGGGFPIYTEKTEGKNLWSLLDTLKHYIPISFSLTELMALYFSTDMLKAFKGTVFHDSLESLSQKIKATLLPESMKYLKSVKQTLQVGIKPYKDYARFREIINRVNKAALLEKYEGPRLTEEKPSMA